MKAIQVHELTSYIKRTIDMDYFLTNILVEGELSNVKTYQSGHTYFNLKDDRASLPCIFFRWEKEDGMFSFKEGDRVLVRGGLSIYEKETRLNLYVKSMTSKGLGPLYQKFLETKEKLEKEGLFDQKYKQKIPSFVKTLGVVTSRDGAVLRDIIHVLKRRNPGVSLVLYPSQVQGNQAPASLRKSLGQALEDPRLDVIIIGRGGGSFEDLMAFQDEDLARDIFCAKTPIISAVGHETDYSISDFVADYRAPTPSAAAEVAVAQKSDLVQGLDLLKRQVDQEFRHGLNEKKMALAQEKLRLSHYSPGQILAREYGRLDLNRLKLKTGMEKFCQRQKNKLVEVKLQVDFYHPQKRYQQERDRIGLFRDQLDQAMKDSIQKRRGHILDLGQDLEKIQKNYPLALIKKQGQLVQSVKDLKDQDYVELILADGSRGARIESKGDRHA